MLVLIAAIAAMVQDVVLAGDVATRYFDDLCEIGMQYCPIPEYTRIYVDANCYDEEYDYIRVVGDFKVKDGEVIIPKPYRGFRPDYEYCEGCGDRSPNADYCDDCIKGEDLYTQRCGWCLEVVNMCECGSVF